MLGHWNGSRKERKGFPAHHPPSHDACGTEKETPLLSAK